MLKRINKSDLPGAPAWGDTLVNMVNNFMQTVNGLLVNGLTFQNNFKCEVKEFTANAPISSYKVSSKIVNPTGVLLLGVFGTGISDPVLSWEQNQLSVKVSISGLTSGNAYKVRLLIV